MNMIDSINSSSSLGEFKLFTGSAGGSPARAPSGAICLCREFSLSCNLLALRARGGRAARAPSEELEWSLSSL